MPITSRLAGFAGIAAILMTTGCDDRSLQKRGSVNSPLLMEAAGFMGVAPDQITLSKDDDGVDAKFSDNRRNMTLEFSRDGLIRQFSVTMISDKDNAGEPGSQYGIRHLSAKISMAFEDVLNGSKNERFGRLLSDLTNDVQAAAPGLSATQLKSVQELATAALAAEAADDTNGAVMALLPIQRVLEEARQRAPFDPPLDLAMLRHDAFKVGLLARNLALTTNPASGSAGAAPQDNTSWTAIGEASVDAAARAVILAEVLPGAPSTALLETTALLGEAVKARDLRAIALLSKRLDDASLLIKGILARRSLTL